ncbi:MAG: glycosyltransferase [Candidatus Aenigmarchaeota archaeon]|nr:glycosyltransferase [Candidatus Aenigmarchaeota archaeon]
MDLFTVAIPACNEEENIKRIDKELIPVMKNIGMPYEILVIDDGSTDKTAEEVRRLQKKYKNIRLVQHDRNLGLGAGTRTAVKNSKGSILLFLDADFTFHPREIPKLLEKYRDGDYDCIIGTQFGKGGKTKMQAHRKFLSKSVNTLYRFMLGRNITTISSIFRLYRKSALKGISMKSNNFDICAEMLFDMIKKNRKITEVPVTLTTRIYGESKISNTREIKNHLKLLSKIAKWRIVG